MAHSANKIFIQVFGVFLLLFASLICSAQSSDVVRARYLIQQVDSGLTTLKRNDVASINGFTDKLKQAQTLLEAEKDTSSAAFREIATAWMATRERLYATLEDWKNPSAPTAAPAPSAESSAERYAQIIHKYQRQQRPRLDPEADAQAAKQWLAQMVHLYDRQWKADQQQAEQWYKAGALSQADYARFQRWVNGTWHTQIGDQIQQRYAQWHQSLAMNIGELQALSAIANDNKHAVRNAASGSHLQNNQSLISRSRMLVDVLVDLESALGMPQENLRYQQGAVIEQADRRLKQLVPLAEAYMAEWRAQPKKSNINPKSQYLWLNGSRFAEITEAGEVWINSRFAGSIGANGEIYVRGSYMGTIQDTGEVWISQHNVSATLMDNGEVWLGGSHVGTIDRDGKVWGTRSASSVEGPGDWRRAAVVFFLQVFPRS